MPRNLIIQYENVTCSYGVSRNFFGTIKSFFVIFDNSIQGLFMNILLFKVYDIFYD